MAKIPGTNDDLPRGPTGHVDMCALLGHPWAYYDTGPHFVDEPNSKRKSRIVSKVWCPQCGERGFRVPPSRVVYTWRSDPANWITEL